MLYWREILLTLSNLLVGHQVFCFCLWCVCVSGVCGCGMFWNRYLSLWVANSIPACSTIICRQIIMCQQIRISPGPGRSSKLTHTGFEIDSYAFQTGCQLPCAVSTMSSGLCFWHNFCGMKWTCRTFGSWWYCLSVEVASPIPAWYTIIFMFLCGFICTPLCQNIKIINKQNAASTNQFLGWEFHRRKPNFETRLYLWLAYIC